MDKLIYYSRPVFLDKKQPNFPCFVFDKTTWDDFSFKTTFIVDFYVSKRDKRRIGEVKILQKGSISTEIPGAFAELDESYCSLGQDNSYYFNLKELNGDFLFPYLDAMNDISQNRGLRDDFENLPGYETSLLRDSEAQKALREGYRIANNIEISNQFKFKFSTKFRGASNAHIIGFDFTEKDFLPSRINLIIGKNGTGKTQYIARLASSLSGLQKQGTFSTKFLPPFSRVLAVSYSLFDRFPKPNVSRGYSYYYCGLQNAKGFYSEAQIQVRLKRALVKLKDMNRLQLFGTYVTKILSDDVTKDLLDEDFLDLNPKEFSLYDKSGFSKYSSGQIIILQTLSEVIASIRTESLLIFDEPETHLHPNAVSKLIEVIYALLKKFNSYAVIATHSPQILQEIPTSSIKVLERIGTETSTRGLGIETFGENVSIITDHVFQVANNEEYYRVFFNKMKKRGMTYDEITKMFSENSLPLSINARIFIESIFYDEKP